MAFHSYVDESIRGRNYFLAEIRVRQSDVGWLRAHVRKKFSYKGQLIHMHRESPTVRGGCLDEISKLPIELNIIWCDQIARNTLARAETLKILASQPDMARCQILVLENISSNYADRQLLSRFARDSSHDFPVFRHMGKSDEPLLVLADVAAWSFGRGSFWRTKLGPILSQTIRSNS